MRNVHLKSTTQIRFESGNMTKNSPTRAYRDVYAIKDDENSNIYHVYIKDPDTDSFTMQPKAMKIISDEMVKITLEGIKLHDKDNRWGFDFSDYGIQFIMSISSSMNGQPGTASLLLKDRDILITYQ